MAALTGPTPVTSGLVFHINMYNSDSFKGAPTTNKLPSPSTNGRFTTGNSWATYNTNQYNGGSYFSIGTISSVSGNIVTTAAAHPLRTFDVMTPQTTGGGVTNGTYYFVKKISSTQFSLHAYNSSQNGSQGYKNQSTGYHKVHDSIALNQQVTLSAGITNMWWGPPHQPNAGIVKEVVDGVGPTGQSVMRLHIHRTDGVADAMAYGVDTPVTAGDVINVSFWIRSNYPGKNLGYSTYFGASSAFSGSTTTTSAWTKVKFQWTASATYNFISYWWPDSSTDLPYWIDMCDLQIETNTGTAAATPFTLTSRSNTQAIIDVTGNTTVTANSVTYASDNTFSFNGSSQYISAPSNAVFNPGTGSFTIQVWCKIVGTTASGWHLVIARRSQGGTGGYYVGVNDANGCNFMLTNNAGLRTDTSSVSYVPFSYNTWFMLTAILDRSTNTQTLIKNNYESVITTTPSGGTYENTSPFNIGADVGNSSYYTNGQIPIVRVYNKALSASEVGQNFLAQKGRFGL